ncbi:MAG: pentapeptide repeat-containing protein [Candidatus Nitrosopolaris sp.]
MDGQQYDAFISHASEDKATIARELARYLVSYGLNIWYDEFTLEIGDSLSEKIDLGLANSRFGIVILSKNFFRKNWPRQELNALATKSMLTGKKVILPVWHEVTPEEVFRYSPTLADKWAAKTQEGLDIVAQKLTGVIKGQPYLESILVKNEQTQKKKNDTKSLNEYLLSLAQQRNISLFNRIRRENLRVSVDFHDCDLSNTNLDGADLYEVNFRNANLENASLRWANFYGATLMEANMSKTYCDHAAFKHANLQSAKLKGANFEYAYLDRADLQYANLTNVSAKYAPNRTRKSHKPSNFFQKAKHL